MAHRGTIPCSVSVITLNSAEGLPACLESLKDFEEIIVCDGNSTDKTREIAESYGARVIRQYDTDEPETRCVMDKAAVRQRAMDCSSMPWRFFMDSDDTLSPEAVEEIRRITSAKAPAQFVWRMPTRIFIDGKEVKHEATYPSFQTRLVHESVGARFKNPVHDRLAWDEAKYPAGTLKSFYNFNWPKERVKDYWGYLGAYARREVQVFEVAGIGFLLWWAYHRLRTIAGYLLWRLPTMYARHGLKESMPLWIELTIVRYHASVLFGIMGKYLSTRVSTQLITETLRGKDLNRILSNLGVRGYEAYGRVLDLGGGRDASYWRYLGTRRWHRKIVVNLAHTAPDIVADLEEGVLPLPNGHADTALMFNVLEHLHNRQTILREVRRVLREGGELVGVVPFLVGVHPDPHDYIRLTEEGLRELLREAGFAVEVFPIGRGPLTASYYQSEFLLPRVLKLLIIPCVLALDRIILLLRPEWKNKFPLSYVFRAR